MRLVVDHKICVGHGKCYMVAPDIFEPDEDDDIGRACPKISKPDVNNPLLMKKIATAISSCPDNAIRLIEE